MEKYLGKSDTFMCRGVKIRDRIIHNIMCPKQPINLRLIAVKLEYFLFWSSRHTWLRATNVATATCDLQLGCDGP